MCIKKCNKKMFRSLNDVERSCLGEYAKEQIRKALDCQVINTNKFKNKIVEIDGIKFRSKKEGKRYCELKALVVAGEVTSFDLQPVFNITNGNKPIRYYADFKVMWKDGRISFEDVKGHRTALYKLKKQLVKDQYGIEIKEL